jgi:exodeoxyribonuclease V
MKKKNDIVEFLDISPTDEQRTTLLAIETFVDSNNKEDVLIVRGSAGTGKSTIIRAITQYLNHQEIRHHLAAPTGRAAMIMQEKSGTYARTIHNLIYIPEKTKNGLGVKLVRKEPKSNTYSIYIIDEASMISDTLNNSGEFISPQALLTDLVEFVKQGNPGNKLIIIGDNYQLPPISKEGYSPALSLSHLQTKRNLSGRSTELTKVMRQNTDSLILKNAIALKEAMNNGTTAKLEFSDIKKNWEQALALYSDLYNNEDPKQIITVAWRNDDVNHFNTGFRNLIGFGSSKLNIDENLMLFKNLFLNNRLILKGDTVKVVDLDPSIEQYAGLHFQNVTIEYTDHDGAVIHTNTKALLETLGTKTGSLTMEQENALLAESNRRNKAYRDSQLPSDDQYVGALRGRYPYAITVHKAQGGEWDNVIIHPRAPFDLRWRYTAVTRASQELYTFRTTA